ncbi:MAG TPA: 50S ribosomal protein L18 [Candidatus Kaiserbacteria bacterium]|nr:50S ribosomal protein L18 [Candidatus Kaiserbacteria bacterium]
MIGNIKKIRRVRRHNRIRAKISGTVEIPRLSVFKSNTQLTMQVIDDEKGKTLVSVSTSDFKTGTLKERTEKAGKKIAQEIKEKNIKKAVFDRGGFLYTGNIKTFADSVRSEGLEF